MHRRREVLFNPAIRKHFYVVRYFMRPFKIIPLYLCFELLMCCNDTSKSDSSKISTHDDTESENSSDENGCRFEDGTHSATVDYYNPETGYSQTYTLNVEVENCEVVQIIFPRGGWLDSDHISPAELNEDGYCTIYGEDGKTYEIQIDN